MTKKTECFFNKLFYKRFTKQTNKMKTKTTLTILFIIGLILIAIALVPQSSMMLIATAPIVATVKAPKKEKNAIASKSSLFGDEKAKNEKPAPALDIDSLIQRIKSFIMAFIPLYLKANPMYDSNTTAYKLYRKSVKLAKKNGTHEPPAFTGIQTEKKERKGIFATELNAVIFTKFAMTSTHEENLNLVKVATAELQEEEKIYALPVFHNVLWTLERIKGESNNTPTPELMLIADSIKI